MKELETPNNENSVTSTNPTPNLQTHNNGETITSHQPNCFLDEIDSGCSTPYVSAPSSPGRGPPLGGFFYSAPASPMHFILSTSNLNSMSTSAESPPSISSSFEFEFSAKYAGNSGLPSAGSMSSADELFLNGQIRPMKLSTHLQRPQVLAPLLDLDDQHSDFDGNGKEEEKIVRGRDLKFRDRSLRRRTRSMSPLRMSSFQWRDEEDEGEAKSTKVTETNEIKVNEAASSETTPSGSSSRSSSVGRSSKRWVFLKEFLYRSKSEGRNNGHKFWSSISFSPIKDKKISFDSVTSKEKTTETVAETQKVKQGGGERRSKKAAAGGKLVNGVGKRRVALSAHELHYTAYRAQAEEMRKKTFLPYRQGLLGCLGFSSKSYGAMNGFARTLNPVSSR